MLCLCSVDGPLFTRTDLWIPSLLCMLSGKHDVHVQVHRWQLQQAAEAQSKDTGRSEKVDWHDLLPAYQEGAQDPEPSSNDVLAELGMGHPLLLGSSPGGLSSSPGIQLRRDSTRSTASRMSGKSPSHRRHATSKELHTPVSVHSLFLLTPPEITTGSPVDHAITLLV